MALCAIERCVLAFQGEVGIALVIESKLIALPTLRGVAFRAIERRNGLVWTGVAIRAR